MNFDTSQFSDAYKRSLAQAKTSPLVFAESFLVDPASPVSSRTFIRANYPQRQIFASNKKITYICIHRRGGKALPLTSEIPTPNGLVPMGDLKVGDFVFTPDGTTTAITALHPQGKKQTYVLVFDDGTEQECCEDHEWEVYTKLGYKGRKKQFGNKILTAKEIAENLTFSYSDRAEFNFKLSHIKPLQYSTKNLPINPYLLGVLLGDGHLKTLEITSADPQIIDRIKDETGLTFRSRLSGSKALRYYPNEKPDIFQAIDKLGLKDKTSKDKFIPNEYLLGDVSQRIALLQGLMDTDGASDKGRKGQAEFCTISPTLANDVANLARSLGCKVTSKESDAAYTKNGIRKVTGRRYRLNIRVPEGIEIFNLDRKKCGSLPDRYLRRTIVDVKVLEKYVDMQCITVEDPKHLFVTGNYAPTHNCLAGDSLVINPETLVPTPIKSLKVKKTLCFDFEENEFQWVDCEWIKSGKKDTIEITTDSGNIITVSLDHPLFCAKEGWKKAEKFVIGDRVLVADEIPIFGENTPDSFELTDAIEAIKNGKFKDYIYSFSKKGVILFINELFKSLGKLDKNKQQVKFNLDNISLAHSIKHILLRLGIGSFISHDNNLLISEKIDLNLFLYYVGIKDSITEINPNRRFDSIVSIQSIGIQDVYDLSVEHIDHNFLASNFIVHNSYSTVILALWHLLTKEGQDIRVFAPSQTQVDLLFKVFDEFIHANPWIQSQLKGKRKDPQYRAFSNRSAIYGYPMGGDPDAKRGASPDVVIVDEAQEMDDQEWAVIRPMMVGDRTRMGKVYSYVAGTIRKPSGDFYEKIYKAKDWENGLEQKIFIPITKNKDFSADEVEMLRKTSKASEWNTEWMLEIGDADTSVFKKSVVDACSRGNWEYGEYEGTSDPKFIGVDWDKGRAGTNIAVFEYSPMTGMITLIYREEVPKSEMTFTIACERIFELYEIYKPLKITCDLGAGGMQAEYLFDQGIKRGSKVAQVVEKKGFQESIEVFNPITQEYEKKRYMKPTLVQFLNQKMQDGRFIFPIQDEEFREQLVSYEVVKTTEKTTTYTSKKEHIIDCALFAMYAIWEMFEQHGAVGTATPIMLSQNQINIQSPMAQYQFDAQLTSLRTSIDGDIIPRATFDPMERTGW